MSTTAYITAEQLLAMPSRMGQRYELVAGELRVMSPAGWRHGKFVSRLNSKLESFVSQNDLGIVFGAETGFRLSRNPDTVRAPDVSFIAKRNLPEAEPVEAYWPVAPDLVVEVLSPDDRRGEVEEKTQAWLDAGCQSVWIVDPRLKTIRVHDSKGQVTEYNLSDVLTAESILPGFTYPVEALFR